MTYTVRLKNRGFFPAEWISMELLEPAEGDVLALVSTLRDLDVTHMGIVVIEGGVPYLLHASSSHGKVEVSEIPLSDFMKRNRQWAGIRVFRLND